MPTTHSLEKTSAISLDEVAGTAPDLIDMYKDAETSLRDRDLIGRRAAVYLVIDRSLSMKPYFGNGTVQRLSDQILSLSAHLDDDGTVPVGFFSDEMHTLARSRLLRRPQAFEEVALGAHQGRIAQLHNSLGRMGGTHYRPAMEAVLDHYRGSKAFKASIPAFVVFQTDGGPQDESATRDFLHATAHENVRWQFVPFGAERQFDLLGRLPGNTGISAVGANPLALSNAELYNRLVTGLPRI
ncbi:VWA domain-containing protein [Streptomyces sp. NBC_00582]|uniref:VWA domain-containing protein n=1 Tax=Streptomyces sp. NBC_00582 TaxID=2975783 RepID=UPI002E8228FA|nr:VWA domain-containing protein [Streptomyces sp. NBC_00582]WUB68583.1 VWA domain-containing protein [Streptomyces sp. NBC_00582]